MIFYSYNLHFFIARSVANALNLINISVPKNELIVGFDDVKDAISSHPTLTTIGSNKTFSGKEAMRTLILKCKKKNYYRF